LRAKRGNPKPVIASKAWQSMSFKPMDRFVPRDDNIFVAIAITIVIASEARQSRTRHCERSVAIHVF
jgi:hypothetical protein